MAGRRLQRWVALIVLAVLLVTAASMQARAQCTGDFDALNKQVVTLFGQGKYAEATEAPSVRSRLPRRIRPRPPRRRRLAQQPRPAL